MKTFLAPGDAVDDDGRRFFAHRAWRGFGFGFHEDSIRHRARDGKLLHAPCARRLRRV